MHFCLELMHFAHSESIVLKDNAFSLPVSNDGLMYWLFIEKSRRCRIVPAHMGSISRKFSANIELQ